MKRTKAKGLSSDKRSQTTLTAFFGGENGSLTVPDKRRKVGNGSTKKLKILVRIIVTLTYIMSYNIYQKNFCTH